MVTVVNLVSLKPPQIGDSASFFDDTIDAVAVALGGAGARVLRSTNRLASDCLNIVWGVGTHLFPDIDKFKKIASPRNTVVFNMEQIGSDSALITNKYIQLLGEYRVLDYNWRNLRDLELKLGFSPRACEFPIRPNRGRYPHITSPRQIEWDCVFYGAQSAKRQAVLRALSNSGLRVAVIEGFGDRLSELILRSKFVLNIHLHQTAIFEVARVLRPISLGVPVLSEHSVLPESVSWLNSGVCFCSSEELVGQSKRWCAGADDYVERSRNAIAFSEFIDLDAVNHVINHFLNSEN